jgi:hypothetical protein
MLSPVLLGAIGGLLPDVLRVIGNRYKTEFEDFYKKPPFWIGLIFLSGLGAFIVYIRGTEGVIEALAIGFSGPQIISKLLGAAPPPAKRKASEKPSDDDDALESFGTTRSAEPAKPKGFELMSWWGN